MAKRTMSAENKQKRIDKFIKANTDDNYGKGNSGAKIPQLYEVEPNDTADILTKLQLLWQLPKPKTDEELAARAEWYFFEYCMKLKIKPTMEGLYIAFDISKETFSAWGNGESTAFKSDLVKKCRRMVQMFLTQSTFEGKLNPIVWMFYGKNYFGMVDKQEMVLTPNRSEADADVQAIQERLQSMQKQLPEGNE